MYLLIYTFQIKISTSERITISISKRKRNEIFTYRLKILRTRIIRYIIKYMRKFEGRNHCQNCTLHVYLCSDTQ